MSIKLTTEQFITRATEVHGDHYDYSLVEYRNTRTKIKIICEIHGEFEQEANSHLKGNGCKACGTAARGKAQVATAKSEFATKASIIHNNKYSYELVAYQGAHTKVKIICPIHGEFLQRPSDHRSGSGCSLCSIESQTYTKSEFETKANIIHNNKYDYSLVDYQGAHTKVKIICPVHGEFLQTPAHHLSGKRMSSLCQRRIWIYSYKI